ncbi:MAG TPA: methyltransferase domain-containing protein [candidate division WOR-3 bacterium]|uniref:Methyltransferase domain-containing protein n=1 Tax=candidate division WOR-3 bacterium TaxID=2052148 RepID=A0A9C9ENP4_UNCW3|nr:methyltransferase domain-containing protein [candidate division WOR-3 bacterium]
MIFTKKKSAAWGLRPDLPLEQYADIIPKGKVLDLGIGEGRNAFYLAKLGFTVEGIDVSKTAVSKCDRQAEKLKLKVKATMCDLREIHISKERYILIICAWVLNFFKRSEIKAIITEIKNGVKKGGFVYVSAFSTSDPSYEIVRKNSKMIEKNTFLLANTKSYYHYFEPQEITSYFKNFKMRRLLIVVCLTLTFVCAQTFRPGVQVNDDQGVCRPSTRVRYKQGSIYVMWMDLRGGQYNNDQRKFNI